MMRGTTEGASREGGLLLAFAIIAFNFSPLAIVVMMVRKKGSLNRFCCQLRQYKDAKRVPLSPDG